MPCGTRLTDEAVVAPRKLTPVPSTFDYAAGATFLCRARPAHHDALVDRGRVQRCDVFWCKRRRRRRRTFLCRGRQLLGATSWSAATILEEIPRSRKRRRDHSSVDASRFAMRSIRLTEGRGADVVFRSVAAGSSRTASLHRRGARILSRFTRGLGLPAPICC